LFEEQWTPPKLTYDLAPGARIYQRNLKNMAALARAQGARFVVLTQPFDPAKVRGVTAQSASAGVYVPVDSASAVRDLSAFNDFARAIAGQSGIELIDMQRLLPRSSSLFADFVHYTSEGIVTFGETLAGSIGAAMGHAYPPGGRLHCGWARRAVGLDSAEESGGGAEALPKRSGNR
jgi:hypothetical protein